MSQQNRDASRTETVETEEGSTAQDTNTDTDQTSGTIITLTDAGFDKASYTVKAGDTVTVKNESSSAMQFSSADHPTHLENPELNMSVIEPGQSGTFVAETAGTFGFHDHLNDQFTGTLVVE